MAADEAEVLEWVGSGDGGVWDLAHASDGEGFMAPSDDASGVGLSDSSVEVARSESCPSSIGVNLSGF